LYRFVLKQLQRKIDVVADRVESADTVENKDFFLPDLVAVKVTERNFWHDWHLWAEGMGSDKFCVQLDRLTD